MIKRSPAASGLLLVATMPVWGWTSASWAEEISDEQLQRLQRLETELRELRDRELHLLRAEQLREVIHDVLADADTRASLLENHLNAGWDDGFFIADADHDFVLEIEGQLQLRYVFNRQENSSDDDHRSGFEMRRMKISFEGELDDIGYGVTGDLDQESGIMELNDASIAFKPIKDVQIRLGRFRPPLLREEMVSSKRQLAVERSLIARTFDQDRTFGVAVKLEGERAQAILALMDSADGLLVADRESWQVSARVDVLLDGDWSELKDYTSPPGEDPVFAIGGGALLQETDFSDPDEDDEDLLRLTLDASAEFGGATLFAAAVGNFGGEEDEDRLDQYGVIVQGGFYILDDWELFAQYLWGDADIESPDLSVIVVGVNHYFHGHAAKWTTDVGYGLNEVGEFWDSSGAGWRDDSEGEEGQVVVRTQLQLLF